MARRLDNTAHVPLRRARCADGNGTLSYLFFSSDDVDVARAKAICGRCALTKQCLQGAITRQEAYGVWGGTLLLDGAPIALPPRRGRPSLTPRVHSVEDEVIIPRHLVA